MTQLSNVSPFPPIQFTRSSGVVGNCAKASPSYQDGIPFAQLQNTCSLCVFVNCAKGSPFYQDVIPFVQLQNTRTYVCLLIVQKEAHLIKMGFPVYDYKHT